MSTTNGDFRTRQTGYEFVLEELRNGTWVIIERLYSWYEVGQAHVEYSAAGHTIKHH